MINHKDASPNLAPANHVLALDGLRGYAALLVAFYHAILHVDVRVVDEVLAPALNAVANDQLLLIFVLIFFNGSTAVQIFYALSGAVLCQSLFRHGINIRAIADFLARRVFRLFPALIACMGLIWLLTSAMQRADVGFPRVSFADVVANSFLLTTKVHGPSTSIQVEALATPFIILFALVYRFMGFVGAIVIFGLSIVAIQKPEIVFSLKNMHASVFVFFAGMLAAVPEARAIFSRAIGRDILLLLFVVFFFRHLVHLESLPALIAQTILIAALISRIMWGSPSSVVHAFLELPSSQFLGKINYSFYLINVPVLWILWYGWRDYKEFAEVGSIYAGLFTGLVSVLITIPLAYFSYQQIELRFIRYGAKLNNFVSGVGRL